MTPLRVSTAASNVAPDASRARRSRPQTSSSQEICACTEKSSPFTGVGLVPITRRPPTTDALAPTPG